MYKKILIATDGSPLSDLAVDQGIDLAAALHARVVFLTATERFHLFSVEGEQLADTEEEYYQATSRRARRLLESCARKAATAGVTAETLHVDDDNPHSAIMAAARDLSCDLIVMSSHGRRGLSAVLLGSETMKVLTLSSIPVLVVRAEGALAVLEAPRMEAQGMHHPSGAVMDRAD